MQKANYLRGVITNHEGNVAKWTKIEASHRENLRESQADGANKCLKIALAKLAEARKKFADLQFPDPNMKVEVKRCNDCQRKIEECTCYAQ